MPRPRRIVLTAAGEGFMYEEPRLQALARLQPIRVHANGRVRDEILARLGYGLIRPSGRDWFARRRWQRRRYGSHAKAILRNAEARRMGF